MEGKGKGSEGEGRGGKGERERKGMIFAIPILKCYRRPWQHPYGNNGRQRVKMKWSKVTVTTPHRLRLTV